MMKRSSYALAILVALVFAALSVFELTQGRPTVAARDFALGFVFVALAVKARPSRIDQSDQ